jgi:hypothetical protein
MLKSSLTRAYGKVLSKVTVIGVFNTGETDDGLMVRPDLISDLSAKVRELVMV